MKVKFKKKVINEMMVKEISKILNESVDKLEYDKFKEQLNKKLEIYRDHIQITTLNDFNTIKIEMPNKRIVRCDYDSDNGIIWGSINTSSGTQTFKDIKSALSYFVGFVRRNLPKSVIMKVTKKGRENPYHRKAGESKMGRDLRVAKGIFGK